MYKGGGAHPATKKLIEFKAHEGNVNCVAIGKTSGGVMVSGGDDKKINLWAIGKPSCIMSLSGHKGTLSSLNFNAEETQIVSGCQNGSIKLWDLENSTIMRMLKGHQTTVTALAMHPFTQVVASGGADTNIKIWDIRKKSGSPIMDHRGHSGIVNHLQFSPDGRWLLSASDDLSIKIWDLVSGKLMETLNGHSAAVYSLAFHPKEFLLASASRDKTVRFWDLERFDMVGVSSFEPNGINAVAFDPQGTCLFSGANNSVRAYSWEPTMVLDVMSFSDDQLRDSKTVVMDMSFSSDSQLVTVSVTDNWVVSHHTTDVSKVNMTPPKSEPPQRVRNYSDDYKSFPVVYNRPLATSPPGSARKTFSFKEQPLEPASSGRPAAPDEVDAGDLNGSSSEIHNQNDYDQIFKSKPRLGQPPYGCDDRKDVPNYRPPTSSNSNDGNKDKSRPVSHSSGDSRVQPPTRHHISPANNDPGTVAGRNQDDLLPTKLPADLSEHDLLSHMNKGHDGVMTAMDVRLRNLQTVRAIWTAAAMNHRMVYPPVEAVYTSKGALSYYQELTVQHRLRCSVFGNPGSGKSSIIQSLMADTVGVVMTPSEGVTNYTWQVSIDSRLSGQFETERIGGAGSSNDGLSERLKVDLGKESAADMESRTVSKLDISFRSANKDDRLLVTYDVFDCSSPPSVCQLLCSCNGIYVIVVDLSSVDYCQQALYWCSFIRYRAPLSPVVIVASQVDGVRGDGEIERRCLEIVAAIKDDNEHLKAAVSEELKYLSDQADVASVRDRVRELGSLQASWHPAPPVPTSCITGSGLPLLKQRLKILALDRTVFPWIREESSVHSQILNTYVVAKRNERIYLLSYDQLMVDLSGHMSGPELGVALRYLAKVGVVTCLSFPVAHAPMVSNCTHFVCTNTRVLMHMLALFQFQDVNRNYRFEANRFWPPDSCRKPDVKLLVDAIAAIPLRGYIRETLFPLLWQCFSISDQQVRAFLKLFCHLGFMVRPIVKDSSVDFSSISLPNYPSLDSKRQYVLPILNKDIGKEPRLNWTRVPFKDDLQIGWCFSFPLGTPADLPKRVVFSCQRSVPETTTYHYLFDHGFMFKSGDVSVHVATYGHGNCVDVTARVHVQSQARLLYFVNQMWIILSRFLYIVETALEEYPGLYRVTKIYPSPFFYGHPEWQAADIGFRLVRVFAALQSESFEVTMIADDVSCVILDVRLLFPSLFEGFIQRSKQLDLVHLLHEIGRQPLDFTTQKELDRVADLARKSTPALHKIQSRKSGLAVTWQMDVPISCDPAALAVRDREIDRISKNVVAMAVTRAFSWFLRDNYSVEDRKRCDALQAVADAAEAGCRGDTVAVMEAMQRVDNTTLLALNTNPVPKNKSKFCTIS